MLAFTLASATLVFSLFTAGSALTVDAPANAVQCAETTINWSAGQGPYNVYVFTGCGDSDDAPLATFLNVVGTAQQWYVNAVSGATVFYQVEDSTGSFFSPDGYIGGSSADSQTCKKHLKDANLETQSIDYSQSASSPSENSNGNTNGPPSDDPENSTPTTQSNPPAVGVANAEQTPTPTPTPKGAIAGSIASGALLASPSSGLAILLLGVGLLAAL